MGDEGVYIGILGGEGGQRNIERRGVLRNIGILVGTEQYWDIRGYKEILGVEGIQRNIERRGGYLEIVVMKKPVLNISWNRRRSNPSQQYWTRWDNLSR